MVAETPSGFRPVWISSILIVGIVLFAISISPTFQICVEQGTANSGEDEQQERQLLASPTLTLIRCGVLTIDANHNLTLALATIVLAVFTISLWAATNQLRKSTNRLWEAGERQIAVASKSADAAQRNAEYLRNANRAFLLPVNPELRNFGRYALGPDDETVRVHFQIKNIGQNPALLRSYAIAHEVCWHEKQGAITPIVRDQFGILPISAGADREFELPFDVFRIDIADLEAMFAVKKGLYIYGYLRYSDFFKVIRRTGFLFEFIVNQDDHRKSAFVVCPHRALWYDEEEKPDTETN